MSRVICVLGLLFAVIGWNAVGLLMQRISFGETSPVLGIGMWIATLPVILGSILAILGCLIDVYRKVEFQRDTSASGTDFAAINRERGHREHGL